MDTKTIKRIVSEGTEVDLNDQDLNKKRTTKLVDARRIYYTLCRDYTTLSLAEIGMTIKPYKNHATVLHNIREHANNHKHCKVYRNTFNVVQGMVENARNQVEDAQIDLFTALAVIKQTKEQNEKLLEENKILSNELNEIQDKIKRQNKYLKENGYKIERSIFK